MKFRNLSEEKKIERQFNYSRRSDIYDDENPVVAPIIFSGDVGFFWLSVS